MAITEIASWLSIVYATDAKIEPGVPGLRLLGAGKAHILISG
jgi:hypothetical protein